MSRYYYQDQKNFTLKNSCRKNIDLSHLKKILEYCLSTLNINEDSKMNRSAIKFIQSVSVESTEYYDNYWFMVTKIIADIHTGERSLESNCVFSQSQLSDFLTLATKSIIDEKGRWIQKNDIIFKILREIVENYQDFSYTLKLNYPQIIVDIISILYRGSDTSGKMVSIMDIDTYYNSRKLAESIHIATKRTMLLAPSTHSFEKEDEILETLSEITGRTRIELKESLTKLRSSDIKRIHSLSLNYNLLQRYKKLIIEDSIQKFQNEIKIEVGRKLDISQLQYAARSVRKVKIYIENVLDGKFVLHNTHGINHIKHNLEYGYQLIGLIKSTK